MMRALRYAGLALLFAYPAVLGWNEDRARNLADTICGVGVLMLLGQGLWMIVRRQPMRHPLAGPSLLAWLGLATFALSLAASIAASGVPTDHKRIYDALLAGGACVFALRLRGSGALWLGCIAGALAMAGHSAIEVWVDGAERARGYHFWVTWGALGMLLGGLPLFARPAGWEQGWRRAALWLGLAAGVLTAYLSGSRAVWLAAAALAGWQVASLRRAWLWRSLGLAAVLVAATLLTPVGAHRWAMVGHDLHAFAAGDADTSLGLRLVMWREALHAWLAHPLLGMGPEGFHHWLAAQANITGPARLAEHGHAHQELLNTLASQGLLGLVALVAAFALPWFAFTQHLRHAEQATASAARAGQGLVAFYVLMGLADTMLVHDFLLTWYATAVMLLLGLSMPERERIPATVPDSQ